jgi:hypothetical protein
MTPETKRRCGWLVPLGLLALIVAGNAVLWPSRTSSDSKTQPAAPTSPTANRAVAERPGPDLLGTVRDTNGMALVGASVFIYTAQPRSGPGFL